MDGHPNAAGYAVITRFLANKLGPVLVSGRDVPVSASVKP
jgi:hypothetical protein